MVRRTAGLGALAAMVVTFSTACDSGDAPSVSAASPTSSATSAASSTTSDAPSSTSSAPAASTPSSSSAPVLGAQADFAPGTCLRDSKSFEKVPCTTPHMLEVSAVVASTAHADDEKKRGPYATAVCNDRSSTYLGSQSWPVTSLQSARLPEGADKTRGTRFVCLVEQFQTNLKNPRTDLTSSLKGALTGDGFFAHRICLKGRASSTNDVDIVPCSAPHASEAVGARLSGKPGQAFPGSNKIQADALKFCTPVGQKFLGTKTRKDILVSQNSGGTGPWSKGQMVTGCFVEVTKGSVTKTMRYITTKPLASVR